MIIVDVNNLAHMNFHALQRELTGTPDYAKCVFGVLRSLIYQIDHNPTTTAVFLCFDGGRSKKRLEVYPEYKYSRNRPKTPKDIEKISAVNYAINYVESTAHFLPVYTIKVDGYEADDMIAGLHRFYAQSRKMIISGDKDLLQLIDPTTSVYSPSKKADINLNSWPRIIHAGGKKNPIPVAHDRWLAYRMMCGDSSDDIPGLPGVGDVTAAKMLQLASLEEILAQPGTIATRAKLRNWKSVTALLKSKKTREILDRNRELMDLQLHADEYARACSANVIHGQWNRQAIEAMCNRLLFKTILSKLHIFERLANRIAGNGPTDQYRLW